MLDITRDPANWVPAKGPLCFSASTLAMIGALVLAVGARAESLVPSGEQAPTSEQETLRAQGPGSSEAEAGSGEVLTPVSEPAPAQPEPVPVQPESAPVQPESAPVAPPEPQPAPPAPEPVAVEPAPAPPEAAPVEREASPIQPVAERAQEVTVLQPTGEHLAEGSGTQQAAVAAAPAIPPPDPAPQLVVSPGGSFVVADMEGGASSGPASGESAGSAVVQVATQLSAAQRAGDLRCQLSGLSGPSTENCTASWLGAQSVLAAYSVEGSGGATATAPSNGGGSDGGDDGSAGGGRPLAPPAGPAPSGAVGSAAPGGSGIGVSGFFTLAGLLLLAAPRAMRRLRLSCRPLLTAFFVLIPERPG